MTTSLKGLLLVLVLMLVMTCVIPYFYAEYAAEAVALDSELVRGGVQDTTYVWMAFVMAILASISALAAKRNDGVNTVA